jgi:hypothetical protein
MLTNHDGAYEDIFEVGYEMLWEAAQEVAKNQNRRKPVIYTLQLNTEISSKSSRLVKTFRNHK